MACRASGCAAVLAVLACVATACAPVSVVESPTEVAAVAVTSERPAHDLAILGAEISPSLEAAFQGDPSQLSLQLMVAVENRGSLAASDVIVEAWLRAPGGQPATALLSAKTIVPYVRPGEVEVAKLTAAAADIPRLQSYVLEVSVRPSAGETYVGNNTSQYSISVSAPPL